MSSHDHGSRKSLGMASNARGDPVAATNCDWVDEDPVCIFNGIVSKMFTTFHRTPLCMSLGHEAEQIRERPTIPSTANQSTALYAACFALAASVEDVPHLWHS